MAAKTTADLAPGSDPAIQGRRDQHRLFPPSGQHKRNGCIYGQPIVSLIRDGKALRGLIAENAFGAKRYGQRPTSSTLLK
jgi:hypothetical protein